MPFANLLLLTKVDFVNGNEMNSVYNQSDMWRKTSLDVPARGSSKLNVGNGERLISAIAGIALIAAGFRKKAPAGPLLTLGGLVMAFRGVSGYSPFYHLIGRNTADESGPVIDVVRTVTVNKPADEVYNFWRKLENLPSFLSHIDSVKELDATKSKWHANFGSPLSKISWIAEIIKDEPGHIISWKSERGSKIDNAGEIRFKPTPGEQSTEVTAAISYRAPLGFAGSFIAMFANLSVEQMVQEDILNFKQLMETGEIPSAVRQRKGHLDKKELNKILI